MASTLVPIFVDPYLELVHSYPLRPIRSRSAHRQALAMLRSLAGRRGSAVRDYKSVLASLVADYERSANLRLDTSHITVGEIILQLLEERGMSANELAKSQNISQSSLSDMLNGRREWSKAVIIRLSNVFGLPAELFLR